MSLRNSLLGLLSYGPMTGYDLKTIFETSVNHFWEASASQIYRDLSELERHGFVTAHIEPQEGRPDKKVYTITETGKQAFVEWLNDFPLRLNPSIRMDFLVRVFFGSKIPPTDLKYQFQKFIKENEADLKHIDSHKDNAFKNHDSPDEDQFFWGLTVKLGYLSAKISIEWAEECIKELDAYLEAKANISINNK